MVKDIHQGDTDHFMNIIGDINGKLLLAAAATGRFLACLTSLENSEPEIFRNKEDC